VIKLLESVFGRTAEAVSKFDTVLIRRATDRLVEGTDPRFKAVRGYEQKLRPAVERTVEYVIELVDSLADPADIAKANYLSDPRLRAFFSSVDHMRRVLSTSQAVSEFIGRRGSVPREPVYAMLAVRHEEQQTFGIKLEAGQVRRDVMQRVYDFRRHQFLAPNTDEAESRWALKARAYDELVSAALGRIVAKREERHAARRERQLLERKLRCLHDGRLGLGAVIEDAPQADAASMESEIARIESELDRSAVEPATLVHYVDLCAETLSTPEKYLRLSPLSLTLDDMGRKVAKDSSSSARTLSLQEVTISSGEHAILMPVRIHPAEIPPPKDFIEEARKYLG
jgi:hypothetical protein